jgi:hypothetical protein
MVPEPEDREALRSAPGVAGCIMSAAGMLAAIGFHDQFRVEAGEVGNVWPKRYLPTKFETGQSAISQQVPEDFLDSCPVSP